MDKTDNITIESIKIKVPTPKELKGIITNENKIIKELEEEIEEFDDDALDKVQRAILDIGFIAGACSALLGYTLIAIILAIVIALTIAVLLVYKHLSIKAIKIDNNKRVECIERNKSFIEFIKSLSDKKIKIVKSELLNNESIILDYEVMETHLEHSMTIIMEKCEHKKVKSDTQENEIDFYTNTLTKNNKEIKGDREYA